MSLLAVATAKPRVRLAPRSATNDVDDATYLSSAYGLTPDPWQEDVLESWLGRRADGRWSAATCGLAVPRQNGKNGVIEIRELYGMAILGERFLHTAHEVKTARKAFLRIASFFENEREYPELAKLVKSIRKTNGQEAIFLDNGGSIEFIARSKGSGRGFTVDVLVCDEAQDLNDEELAALLPTISASPLGNPQVILTGTPPQWGKGLPFRRVREDGEAKRDARLAWTDFGAPDGPMPDVDDRRAWVRHNPAEGLRLTLPEMERERQLMAPDLFAAERMGWWGNPASDHMVMPNWGRCSTTTEPDPPAALGIALDQDRIWLSLGASSGGEVPHLGSMLRVRLDQGRGRFVTEVARVQSATGAVVVIDRKGPAETLERDLSDAGVTITWAGLDDYLGACADLYDAVESKQVTHGDYDDLNEAVGNAEQRRVGDRWAWSRRNGDVSMLEAVTLALWGAQTPDYDVTDSVF
jgi:hypothetical protein